MRAAARPMFSAGQMIPEFPLWVTIAGMFLSARCSASLHLGDANPLPCHGCVGPGPQLSLAFNSAPCWHPLATIHSHNQCTRSPLSFTRKTHGRPAGAAKYLRNHERRIGVQGWMCSGKRISEPSQAFKSQLPIDDVLTELQDKLEEESCVVLVAPPGAGKTTRVPLAMIKANFLEGKSIVMLEPRRLAARASAARMASELNEPVGQTVGYRVRQDSKVGAQTRIEVVTEGVLTRRIQVSARTHPGTDP